jgi:hypothetical protein
VAVRTWLQPALPQLVEPLLEVVPPRGPVVLPECEMVAADAASGPAATAYARMRAKWAFIA